MQVVIIGAGHNGLTAAFYLARAGLKPLVLERRDVVGGGAITGELYPGFQCPTLAHHTSVRADIAREMELTRHGVEFLDSGVEVCAPALEGPPALVYRDDGRTGEALRRLNRKDADAYSSYRTAVRAVADVLASLLTVPAPSIDDPGARDLWNLLRSARRFRSLGEADAYRLLRWIPMPVADMAAEWFECDLIRALVAARGLSGTMLGPRSAGSALVLLLHEANRLLAGRSGTVRGGPGALTAAMASAARAAGAEIQTGVRVDRIITTTGGVAGVVADGREVPAAAVVSAVDPKTTLLDLVGPLNLAPDLVSKMRAYRAAGTMAKVNLALSALPAFAGLPAGSSEHLSGRIHLGPGLDYLERAFDHVKYGEMSAEPWLDVTIPSVLDPTLSPPGAHVMSIYSHYAPRQLRAGTWDTEKPALLKRTLATLARFSPGIDNLIVAAQVITPADLETEYGFHGGHIFHGELSLDQLATMRPLLGYARYKSPVRGLYLCSAGTHPGGFMSGGSGRMAAAEVRRLLGA